MLTVQDREALSQLQLFARGVVEGIHVGRHRSPHKGASLEFKEHRQYARGDEIRAIDWKLFGKTDRLFIRQYEDETSLRAMILLDQSGSMAYQGKRARESKHQFAVRLSACLATLLISQQDAVGLATLDTELRCMIPARSKPSHLQVVFESLVQSRPGGETQLSMALQQSASQLRRRGMIVLVSDCFDSVDDVLKVLGLFRHSGSEIIVFQILDPDELDFPFHQRTKFKSLENPAWERMADPRAVRESYLARLGEFQRRLSQGLLEERIDFIPCTSDMDYSRVLSTYLESRNSYRKTASLGTGMVHDRGGA